MRGCGLWAIESCDQRGWIAVGQFKHGKIICESSAATTNRATSEYNHSTDGNWNSADGDGHSAWCVAHTITPFAVTREEHVAVAIFGEHGG